MQDGFTQVPNQVLADKSLSAQAKLLYSLLLSHAWEKNEVFPGQKSLGERMGCSTKTVRKYIRELEKARLLQKKRRGLNHTNLYTLSKWISTDYEREKLPIKKQLGGTIKKGSQFPSKNTQVTHTQIKKNKSERENTHSPLTRSNGKTTLTYQEIIDLCEPYLKEVSMNTFVEVGDVRNVLGKMASHYAAEGKNFNNWVAKLTNWVLKDVEDEKIEKSFVVAQEIKQENIRKEFGKVARSILGENWKNTDGLVEKVNSFVSAHGGFNTPLSEFKSYLEYLKESLDKGEVND